MPRQSAEARATSHVNITGRLPPAPDTLTRDARKIWDDVVASKPADWFDTAAQLLLEGFCEETAIARRLVNEMKELNETKPRSMHDRGIKAELLMTLEKRLVHINQSRRMSATKLRLSIQTAVDWSSRKLSERAAVPAASAKGGRKTKRDTLLGGGAVWTDDDIAKDKLNS